MINEYIAQFEKLRDNSQVQAYMYYTQIKHKVKDFDIQKKRLVAKFLVNFNMYEKAEKIYLSIYQDNLME